MESELETLDRLLAAPHWYGFAFVLGALFGSFANVCIARLPLGMSVARPPSHCFACKAPVAWYDNLPIVSYFVLRGRCRRCKSGYSPRYMLVEAATGLLFAATWHLCLFALFPDEPLPARLARFAIYAAFQFVMVVVTFIDIDHKLILDVVSLPSILVFAVCGFLLRDRPWWDQAIGIALGYGLVRGISDLYYFLTKREGLGYGDGKLLAVIGALLGWQGVLVGLFGGALLGSVFGVVILLAARRQQGEAGSVRHAEIPFGPYIVAAALTYLYLQEQVHVGFARFMWPPPY
jgi:leader peptidase (prepilin peptidase)/N-methyltransferase